MTIKTILTEPNKILRQVSKTVDNVGKDESKKEPRYFVNPVIKNKDPIKFTYEEGCLSVPNQFAEIDRPGKCEVEYLDYNGKKRLLKADGYLRHVYSMKWII